MCTHAFCHWAPRDFLFTYLYEFLIAVLFYCQGYLTAWKYINSGLCFNDVYCGFEACFNGAGTATKEVVCSEKKCQDLFYLFERRAYYIVD